MRIFLTFLMVSLASISITYLLHRFFKKHKYVKYIPSLIFILVTIYNFLMARIVPSYGGFEDLARIIVALFAFTAFISSFGFGIFIDKIMPILKKSRSNRD